MSQERPSEQAPGEQESVEHLVRAGYGALSDGDLDSFLEGLDPGIELVTSGAFPDFEPVYRGHEGILRFWAAITEPWESFQLETERIVVGEDRAAVVVHFRVKGAGSGVMTELKQGHALWLRQGRTFKVSTHPTFEQALEAAGLSE
jgi:ketosteroid isomerase-like protein